MAIEHVNNNYTELLKLLIDSVKTIVKYYRLLIFDKQNS